MFQEWTRRLKRETLHLSEGEDFATCPECERPMFEGATVYILDGTNYCSMTCAGKTQN